MRKYDEHSDKKIMLLQEIKILLFDLTVMAEFFFDLNYNFYE